MRHHKRRTRLSMMTSRRDATLRNMVRSLIQHQRIETTLARAKEAKRLAERLITSSRDDSVDSRRRAYSVLADRDLVSKLFKEVIPLFKTRTSGYTRIITTGFRRGDGATMAILELTDKSTIEKLPKKKKEKSKAETAPAEGGKAASPGSADEAMKPQAESKKEHKKEEPKAKTIPRSKPSLEEEKRTEKAKSEDKKAADKRGFMKNIRGLFRKRGDR